MDRGRAAEQRVLDQLDDPSPDPTHRLTDGDRDPERAGGHPLQVLPGEQRILGALPERPRDELGGARLRHRPPRLGRGQIGLRTRVEQHLADVDVVHAVDQGQMGLRHDREAIAFQPFDDVDLPQRPRSIQPPGHHSADELAQLLHRSRSWQRRPADVEGEVEALVVHPDRGGQPDRHVADPLPVTRDVRDPLADQSDEPLVVEAVGFGVEDVDGGHVGWRMRGVQHEQGHLQRRQSLRHRIPFHRGAVPGSGADRARAANPTDLAPDGRAGTDGASRRDRARPTDDHGRDTEVVVHTLGFSDISDLPLGP